MQTTWKTELAQTMQETGDTSPVIAYAPDEAAFDIQFENGGSNGPDVLAWTKTRVYFPVVYDGAEWLGSAPRNPQAYGQHHVGGK
ncbi:MAG: hypothetical protein ACRDMV_21010 [Streptosporangiales bacterium]